MTYPSTPDFPYKHILFVKTECDDEEVSLYYKWLQENVSPCKKNINGVPHYRHYFQYKGTRLVPYGVGDGWCATFPDYCLDLSGATTDDDIIGIDDPDLATLFALKFCS